MKYRKIGGILTRKERKALMKSKDGKKKLRKQINMIMLAMPAVGVIQGKLGFKKGLKDGDFLLNAKVVLEALTLDTGSYFGTPFDDMVLFGDLIAAFDVAMQNSKIKVIGSGAAKKLAKTALFNVLKSALEYVNKIARQLASQAEEVITSAKLLVRGTSYSKKLAMSAKKGGSTLEALLQCRAVRFDLKYYKANYNWQSSIDGGATWVSLPDTTEAKLLVTGLTLGQVMKFRFRSNSKKGGLTKWCIAVDYTVV